MLDNLQNLPDFWLMLGGALGALAFVTVFAKIIQWLTGIRW